MIPETLLLEHGARLVHYEPGETIFHQEEQARNFYQIRQGQVRITSINESGREFIQGMFAAGESFGEPALFADIQYPASATVLIPTDLLVMTKFHFLDFLKSHPEYYLTMLQRLSLRLHYKATIVQAISTEQAETRILTLIDYLKQKEGKKDDEAFQVTLTRQQIADLIGLRVETVIRAIGTLKNKKEIKVRKGKIVR